MRFLALAGALSLSLSASAQTVPHTEASQKATKDLKVFTKQLGLADPPLLYEGPKGYADHFAFKTDFHKSYHAYHALWTWSEDGGPDDGLSDEKFQTALGVASNRGTDTLAGLKWTCDLADKARGYFMFYNVVAGRGDAALNLLGTSPDQVRFGNEIVDAIAARYKAATGVDIKTALRYNLRSECESQGETLVTEYEKEHPDKGAMTPPPSKFEVHKDPTPWEKPDFTKYNYFVYYWDASWQSWDAVAHDKHWDRDDLEKFVLRRAPEWVGSFVARAPKADKEAFARTYRSTAPGEVLRHPLQPKTAKDRDPKLIAEHKKKYKMK